MGYQRKDEAGLDLTMDNPEREQGVSAHDGNVTWLLKGLPEGYPIYPSNALLSETRKGLNRRL
jgi:hypothetical protein